MVKFTFVSVFLILTATSVLVFAAPTDFAKYAVRIRGSDLFLLSDGAERAGQPISMVTGYIYHNHAICPESSVDTQIANQVDPSGIGVEYFGNGYILLAFAAQLLTSFLRSLELWMTRVPDWFQEILGGGCRSF
ncbi:hypothetical protein F5887DRAFT_1157819 [Amanita rubescens]|nr:hypothetical protein F5887DRAFT_1157819 [Amanita rubescens]